jgi:YbbR domain-containing protein
MSATGTPREEFLLKIASFVLALTIWGAVRAQLGDATRSIEASPAKITAPPGTRAFDGVPITVLADAGDRRGFKVSPGTVNVLVSGEAASLRALNADEIEAYVSLVDVVEARSLRKNVRVRLPAGLKTEAVAPPDVVVDSAGLLPTLELPKEILPQP